MPFKPQMGKAFEDFGSGFPSSSSQSSSKSKNGTTRLKSKTAAILESEDDSDEMDCLSQRGSQEVDADVVAPKPVSDLVGRLTSTSNTLKSLKFKKTKSSDTQDPKQGAYPLSSRDMGIKKPNLKIYGGKPPHESALLEETPIRHFSDESLPYENKLGKTSSRSSSDSWEVRVTRPKWSEKNTLRLSSPPGMDNPTPRARKVLRPKEVIDPPVIPIGETAARVRPKPKPLFKEASSKGLTKNPDSPQFNSTTNLLENMVPKPFPLDLKGLGKASDSPPFTSNGTSLVKRASQPFPLDPTELKAPDSPPRITNDNQMAKKAPLPFPLDEAGGEEESSARGPLTSRDVDPKAKQKGRTRRSKKVGGFPSLSPLSSHLQTGSDSSVRPKKSKSKVRSKQTPLFTDHEGDEDDSEIDLTSNDEQSAPSALQPFPMSMKVLKSIGSSPVASGSMKRNSPSGGDEQERKKRRENGTSDIPHYNPNNDYMDYGSDEDVDNLFLSRSTDPSTLCPYCDTPLPVTPTPKLQRLFTLTAAKSHRDPRPSNPLGRKAPLAVFIEVCQRHRFEGELLPEAARRGWPSHIDWDELQIRVLRMKGDFRELIEAGDGNGASEEEMDELNGGARESCVFWQEVVKEVKARGSRAVAGVAGQFASFEKTQTGYYGEMGAVIMHQTLYNLFPPSDIDPTKTAPLTPAEFIQRILVPEAGARLIMEDQDVEMTAAVQILRDSAGYGVAMFPQDDGERRADGGEGDGMDDGGDEEMGVADAIVMERARKRRIELEEEEGIQDALWEQEQAERERKSTKRRGRTAGKGKLNAKGTGKGKEKVPDESDVCNADKGKGKAKALESSDVVVEERVKRKPKPRPIGTAKPKADPDLALEHLPPTSDYKIEIEGATKEHLATYSNPELNPHPIAALELDGTSEDVQMNDEEMELQTYQGILSPTVSDFGKTRDDWNGRRRPSSRGAKTEALRKVSATPDSSSDEEARKKGKRKHKSKSAKSIVSEDDDEAQVSDLKTGEARFGPDEDEDTPRPARTQTSGYSGDYRLSSSLQKLFSSNVDDSTELDIPPSLNSSELDRFPLMKAKSRGGTLRKGTSNDWSHSMAAPIDISSEDDRLSLPADTAATSQGSEFSWLLSDSSAESL